MDWILLDQEGDQCRHLANTPMQFWVLKASNVLIN